MTTIDLSYGTFQVDDGDATINPQAVTDRFWDPVLKPVFDRVPEGSLAIDVGAHVGFYSVYLAKVRRCQVIAIEGHPRYRPLLIANTKGLSVRVQSCFAYSRFTRLVEHQEHSTAASNTWLPSRRGGIHARPLDAWLPILEWMTEPLTFVKVDAQGADLHVLQGAERLVERYHPALLVEFEPALAVQHGHSRADYEDWYTGHAYVWDNITDRDTYLTWRGAQ